MLSNKKLKKSLAVLTGMAMLMLNSVPIFALPGTVRADISVRGVVSVNGQLAVSNSTVVSGSTITTGDESGAVIGIGANGRVELLPSTSIDLDYSDSSIEANLTSGSIRISTAQGVTTIVSSEDKTLISDPATATTFSFDGKEGKLSKGSLKVSRAAEGIGISLPSGKVVRLKTGESVAIQDDDDDDDPGSGAWFIWALVLGGAAAGIIIAATNDNDIQLGGGTTVVSPNAP